MPPGVRLTPVDRPAADLAAAFSPLTRRTTPISPPSRTPSGRRSSSYGHLSGRPIGPLLRCKRAGGRGGRRGAGAVLVNASPASRRSAARGSRSLPLPAAPGVGRPLLRRALAVATRDGLPAVGLAVTDANPARRVYAALGFEDRLVALNVQL